MTLRGEPPRRYTERELVVLRAVRDEGSMSAAARSLGISLHTVNAHLAMVRAKRGVHFTWQAFDLLS